jgi:hypothetical protein
LVAEQHEWHLDKGYARCGKLALHRLILEPPSGKQVDHINRDRLDNRRSNLRPVDAGQNTQNRGRWPSKRRFRNVELDRRRKVMRWRVNPRTNGRNVHVGYYATEFEAAIVAEAWRAKHTPYAPKDPVFLHFVDVGLDEAA